MTGKKLFKIITTSTILLIAMTFIIAFGFENVTDVNISSEIQDKNACIIVKYTSNNMETLTYDGIKARQSLAPGMELLELSDPYHMLAILEEVKNMEGVEYAQPNYILRTNEITDDAYIQQWGLNNTDAEHQIDINAEAAWEVEEGSSSVTVGILDTGIDDSHPEIKKAIKNNGYNFVDNNSETYDEKDGKHGTGIAGIIAAKDDDKGIRGVASGVEITPLKVMDQYKGYTSDIILAIQYAEDEGISIVNCSFGSYDNNPALKEVMQNSAMLFVCSAGNEGKNVDEMPYYPACFDLPNVLSVGSINAEGKISSFSNYGQSIDVLAPGEEIYSTIPNEEYYSFGGTSMSAAYVTGVAALVKSRNHDAAPAEIANKIVNTVRKYPDYAQKTNSGGIVDAYAALTNEVTPAAENALFADAENEANTLAQTTTADLTSDMTMAVSTAGEIEPITAQLVHYGESGVNSASGNFSFTVTDFNDSAPGGNFTFARYYNSLDQEDNKTFGRGWSSVLDAKIYDPNRYGQEVTVTMPTGSTHKFTFENGVYTSRTTRNILIGDSDTQYTLKQPSQEEYIFTRTSNHNTYKLTHIKDKTGNTIIQIVYNNDDFPSYMLDSAGRKYTIKSSNIRTVESITDPYGRTVRYNCIEHESPEERYPFFLLHSWTDMMGTENVMAFRQKDDRVWMSGDVNGKFPYTDTFVSDLWQTEPGGDEQHILAIEYNVKSYDPDYGKVMSYTDAYEETYTYDYDYMFTNIKRVNSGNIFTEYYDSYMYVYKTEFSMVTNDVTERRYYRPDGRNYGEILQEWRGKGNQADITTYIREPETGNVQQKVNPDGSTVSYWYDIRNNVIGMLDEDENCTLYVYNTDNELLKKANYLQKGFPDIANKNQIDQYITQHSDQFIVESYTYSDGGNDCPYTSLLEQVTDPEGNCISLTYDKYGNVLTHSKPYAPGETPVYVNYEYYVNYVDTTNTSAGMQTKPYIDFVDDFQTNYYTLGMEEKTVSPGNVISINYKDNNGTVYKNYAKDGEIEETTRTVYDVGGRKQKEITARAYAENNCSSFEKINSAVVNIKTQDYTYYAIGFEDAAGEYPYATEYQYYTETGPGYNQVKSVTYPEVDGARRDVEQYAYERANLTQSIDPDGREMQYTYDELERLDVTKMVGIDEANKSQTISVQKISRNIDDNNGFIMQTANMNVFVGVRNVYVNNAPMLNTIEYSDYKNNVTKKETVKKTKDNDSQESSTTNNVYNKNGTIAKSYNSYGNMTYYVYDNLNRLTETWEAIDADSATYYRYTKKDYYKNGNVKTEYVCTQPVKVPVDAEDHIIPSSEEYRTLVKKDGQTTTASDYIVANYTYYSSGQMKTVNANNGVSIQYEYDADGNLCTEIKNGIKTTYENTYFGQVTYKHEYLHPDDLELTDSDIYEMDGDYAVLTTEYKYAHGLLMEVVNPNGTSVYYEYDGRDRQTAVSQNGPFVDHQGETVEGTCRTAKKLDWKGNLKEETVEEIVDGETTVISKTVYEPKVDKMRFVSNIDCYYLYEQKVEQTSYDLETGDETVRTSLYYTDPLDRIIAQVTPNNYIEDGVVSLGNLYQDTFSEEEDEMNRTEYEYDAKGNLIREIERYRDPNENNAWKKVVTKTYTYDENGNVIEVTDALGNSTKAQYTLSNQIFIEKDPVAQENHYSFSKKYAYDALGRVVKETDSAKYDTVYNYDDLQSTVTQINAVTQPDGTQQTIQTFSKYDLNKNLIESYVNDPSRKFTYSYNERGQIVEQNAPYDETVPQSNVAMKYDSMGNVVEKIVGTERLETYVYDIFGNNTSATVSKLDGTEAITTTKAYDSRGNIRFETDGNQNTVEHKYDGFGQEIESLAVHPTYYTYDSNGNQTNQTDWRGNTVQMTYDPLNRLIEKTDAEGTVVEKLYYNDNGLQTKFVDALGAETTYTYDKNNRLLSTTDPLNHTSGQTYNRAGQIASQYDGNGNTKFYGYDELGRLLYTKQTADGVEEVTNYTYDVYGNLLTQTNGEGHTTTFMYNALNLRTAKMDHEGIGIAEKTESYQYDERGNLIAKTDRNGTTLNYIYDVHNRLIQTKLGDTVLIAQTYDGNGNKLTMQDESGTTTRTYDALNRVLTKDVPNMGTTTYQYDITSGVASGQVAEKAIDPKQNITVKTYDKNGRLFSVKGGENAQGAKYEYYPNGAQKKVTNPNGSTADYTYYEDGMLKSLTNKNASGNVIDSYNYTYDAAKNQLSKTETVFGEDKGTTSFTYDSMNRLKTVTEPSNKVTEYGYDKAGNRKIETVTENGVVSQMTYTYNEQERLMNTVQTAENTTKTVFYYYDNNGNLYGQNEEIIKPDTGEMSETAITLLGVDADSESGAVYEYNVFNQLVKTYQGSNTITNVYNGEGLRVSKTVNGNTCNYLYEYDKIVLETDESGNQTARNVYGTSLISRKVGTETYTYHYNGHGDVTALTDQNGTSVAGYYYDAFGKEMEKTGEADNPFRYSGYAYDEETELYYLKSRFYSAETARFMQEDTYRGDPTDPLSLNLYTYCANNPISYWDPTGFSYHGTEFADFNDFYHCTIEDPERAEKTLHDLYNNSFSDFYALLNEYVGVQGGLKKGNNNVYQVIYTAMPGSDDPSVKNSRNMNRGSWDAIHAERNMYDDYQFSIFDAMNWLLQSGGSGNFILQTRVTEEWYQASNMQKELIGDFLDARTFLRAANIIDEETTPQLYIGSTETSGNSTVWIYQDIMGTGWVPDDIIGGIYYGHEDDTGLQAMKEVSNFAYEKGKKLIWIPYVTETRSAYDLTEYATIQNFYGKPIFDVIIIQPGGFYGGDFMDQVFDAVREYNEAPTSATRIGMEMEFDMGLVTGRQDADISMDPARKRAVFRAYIDNYNNLIQKHPNVPIGVYSGGPNEQGYRNIRSNTGTHNSGNHIPYGDGIIADWYAYGVPYSAFPDQYTYKGGNLMYDINEYIYNGVWKEELGNFLWKFAR